ncbi:helix-turn-helix domain-containing protein, partial [Vibrio wakamikoensis]
MSQRELFIEDWLSHRFSISELCQRYGIARKTGYKWINRFREQGMTGLTG